MSHARVNNFFITGDLKSNNNAWLGPLQEGYIEELTRFSQYLNAKTCFVNF